MIRYAGLRRPSAIHFVLGIRVVLATGLPALAAPMLLAAFRDRMPFVILVLTGLAMLGFLLPIFVVRRIATNRQIRIDGALSDVLDLLVLCVESGLSLNAAIARVAEERSGRDPLGEEMAQLANELQVGVPRRDALRNLSERVSSSDLRTVVAHVIQTDRLGGNVGPALRAQSEAVRAGRKLRAEEIANRLPIKMLIPTVLFMPALMIVVFVPVALQAIAALRGGE
jgi:tight adherence protein C